MSKFGLWAIAGIAVSTLLYLVYTAFTFEAPAGTTTVVIAPPGLQPIVKEPPPSILPEIRLEPEPEPPAIAASEPVVETLPVEVVEPESEPVVEEPDSPVVQLPNLSDSDSFVFEGLRAIRNGVAVIRLLASDQLVRKFVVLVDNISRGEYPQTGLPYRGVEQEMPVQNIDENLFVMDASAHGRFDQIIDIFVALDTDQAVTLYQSLSPLFQQAYTEIGFRNVNFDDTLRSAVNIILRTPYIEGPYQLVKPSVMYLYADASIENLQNVQKQLIRIGPENTEKIKAKLRDFVLRL
ncbi:MAG TPA: DUF3014 domain-containing protein [Gammaproteobacteria bacterium]|nr:DUF3014 domain-containing protein [Gammaproteobacteria bacterium]|tara:strand:- start:1250 stop:2131 length:882 start_codon:yes stop_codon:yes gene_type:complete